MFKIRDDVDLEELERFNYKLENWDNYYRKKESTYRVQINIFDHKILVYKLREKSDWGDYIGYSKEDEEEVRQYIADLIQAGLVERI